MPFDALTWALLGASIVASGLFALMFVAMREGSDEAVVTAVLAMYLEQGIESVAKAGYNSNAKVTCCY